MRDLVFVALTAASFGLMGLLVAACDRIVGADPTPQRSDDGARGDDREVVPGMTFDNVAGLVVSVLVIGYLIAALVAPERF